MMRDGKGESPDTLPRRDYLGFLTRLNGWPPQARDRCGTEQTLLSVPGSVTTPIVTSPLLFILDLDLGQ